LCKSFNDFTAIMTMRYLFITSLCWTRPCQDGCLLRHVMDDMIRNLSLSCLFSCFSLTLVFVSLCISRVCRFYFFIPLHFTFLCFLFYFITFSSKSSSITLKAYRLLLDDICNIFSWLTLDSEQGQNFASWKNLNGERA